MISSKPVPASSRRRRVAGFTLVELNIVVAVIAILAAVAFPSYRDYVERARIAQVLSMIDVVREKSQIYAASRGLDFCRWTVKSPPGQPSDEYAALTQIFNEGLQAIDPDGKQWPRRTNKIMDGDAGKTGPYMVFLLQGSEANAHRARLLAGELEKAGILDRLVVNGRLLAGMTAHLGPPCKKQAAP